MDNMYKSRRSRGGNIFTAGGGDSGSLNSSDQSRILPRQLSTGSTRGVQTVGYGTARLDGSNNRITIGTPDGGTIGFGSIPGSTTNEFGFFSIDTTGTLIMKIVNGTWFVYRADGTNVMQSGILPDSTVGWAVAADGYEVADGFTS